MELSLPLPQTNADLMIYVTGIATLLYGLFALFMPRLALRALRLGPHPLRPDAVAEARSTVGGFYLGLGLMTIMFYEQWTLPLVIGTAWLFSAFGRLVSILSDDASTLYNWLALILALILAGLPLAAVFGFVPA